MRLLRNRNIKKLFVRIFSCIAAFAVISIIILILSPAKAALWIFILSILMGLFITAFCFLYFKKQNEILEEASAQIREFLHDRQSARIICEEEGELYQLFHEVNSLVTILNAQAENEEKSKKFLRRSISDISHQLKTPLAALDIYNSILKTEAEEKELDTIKKFCDLSEQELGRIETLVQNLLKITRFDTGTIIVEKSLEDISEIMLEVKKHFSVRAELEGKKLILSESSSGVPFPCDRNWMIEAISNIVKNALDHTKSGDCIWLEVSRFASIIRITIKDNGSGIHPEDLYHIFKRFYRSRFSKDTQGIGLGLSLAKAVIEAHDGTIEVDSELGRGSTFTINLLIPTKL